MEVCTYLFTRGVMHSRGVQYAVTRRNRNLIQSSALCNHKAYSMFKSPTRDAMGGNQPRKEIFKKIAADHEFENNFELTIKPTSSDGANYTSKLFRVTIKDLKKRLDLFVKLAATGEKYRSQIPRIYETENIAYSKVVKIYEELEDEYNLPEKSKLSIPKFYGFFVPAKFQETIVLEDLTFSGYQSYDRFKPVDWPYAEAAIGELVKWHSLSLAYSKNYPQDYKETSSNLHYEWEADKPLMDGYFEQVIGKAVEETREENKTKLQAFFKDFDKHSFRNFYKSGSCQVLSHGDFRPSNLLNKPYKDGSVDIKVVDLQTLHGGSPVVDLLYFIFTGSDEQFRAQYFDKLVDYYYSELSAAMKRLHLIPDEVYSRKDFDFELKQKLPFGLTVAVFALPVITVETENAPKVDKDMDVTSFSVQKTSELYKERINGVVNDFVKWGIL